MSKKLKEQFLALLDSAELITERSAAGNEKCASPDQPSNKSVDSGAVDRLLTLLDNDTLYISADDGASYVFRKARLFVLDAKNKELCEDLRFEGFEATGKAPSKETVATVIELLSAKSRRDGERIDLFNRIGSREGLFYYNLGTGKAVEVGDGSWRVVDTPIMFREFKHQHPQFTPHRNRGNIRAILHFLRLKEDQHLLFLITLVTCFVPEISHPAVHVTGTQGSGKSFSTKLIKRLIDPSSVLLSMMPRRPEDLDLLLVRHKALVLDNLSNLNFDTCDRLCSVISGGVAVLLKNGRYTPI